MTKRIIICCDGTWQDLEQAYPTNVAKMVQAIAPRCSEGSDQIVYYNEGLGTDQIRREGSLIDGMIKWLGGGLGTGIDYKIQKAYTFLCLNYQPGDEIYLAGFSRGAYTIRCLAGLIYNAGLPHRQFIRMIPEAYALYRNASEAAKPSGSEAMRFRGNYGDRPPIKALCCWDTVASLGIPNLFKKLGLSEKLNKRYQFHDCRINPLIEHAFHAVAIDEDRKVFDYTPMQASRPGQLSQVWFAGGHGSVGGGDESDRDLADRPLEWILDGVAELGLAIDTSKVEYGTAKDGSLTYGIQSTYNGIFKPGRSALGHQQRIMPPETSFNDLDISVKQRWQDKRCNYRPAILEHRFGSELDRWSPPV